MLPYPVDAKYVVYLCLLLGFCGFPKIAVIIYAFCHPSTCGPDFFEEEDIPEQEIVTYDWPSFFADIADIEKGIYLSMTDLYIDSDDLWDYIADFVMFDRCEIYEHTFDRAVPEFHGPLFVVLGLEDLAEDIESENANTDNF